MHGNVRFFVQVRGVASIALRSRGFSTPSNVNAILAIDGYAADKGGNGANVPNAYIRKITVQGAAPNKILPGAPVEISNSEVDQRLDAQFVDTETSPIENTRSLPSIAQLKERAANLVAVQGIQTNSQHGRTVTIFNTKPPTTQSGSGNREWRIRFFGENGEGTVSKYASVSASHTSGSG